MSGSGAGGCYVDLEEDGLVGLRFDLLVLMF